MIVTLLIAGLILALVTGALAVDADPASVIGARSVALISVACLIAAAAVQISENLA